MKKKAGLVWERVKSFANSIGKVETVVHKQHFLLLPYGFFLFSFHREITPRNLYSLKLHYRISPNKRSWSYAKHGYGAFIFTQLVKRKFFPILYFFVLCYNEILIKLEEIIHQILQILLF